MAAGLGGQGVQVRLREMGVEVGLTAPRLVEHEDARLRMAYLETDLEIRYLTMLSPYGRD